MVFAGCANSDRIFLFVPLNPCICYANLFDPRWCWLAGAACLPHAAAWKLRNVHGSFAPCLKPSANYNWFRNARPLLLATSHKPPQQLSDQLIWLQGVTLLWKLHGSATAILRVAEKLIERSGLFGRSDPAHNTAARNMSSCRQGIYLVRRN